MEAATEAMQIRTLLSQRFLPQYLECSIRPPRNLDIHILEKITQHTESETQCSTQKSDVKSYPDDSDASVSLKNTATTYKRERKTYILFFHHHPLRDGYYTKLSHLFFLIKSTFLYIAIYFLIH